MGIEIRLLALICLFLGIIWMLMGCSVVETYRADGTLEARKFSVAPIVNLGSAPITKVRAVGVIAGNGAVTAGYVSALTVHPPEDCFAMIILASAYEASRWAKIAAETNGLCRGEIE